MPKTAAPRKPDQGPGAGRLVRRREYSFTIVHEKLIMDPNVGHQAFRLWCVLDRWIGPGNDQMPTQDDLAVICDCHRNTVGNAIKELVAAGWLESHQYGLRQPNGYVLLDESERATQIPSVHAKLNPGSTTGCASRSTVSCAREAQPVVHPSSIESLESSSGARRERARRGSIHAVPDQGPDDAEPVRGTVRRRARDGANTRLASEPALGADARVERRAPRADTGKGLSLHFEALARAQFSRKELAFGQFNQDAVAAHCASMLRDGVDADTIRTMVRVFMTENMPDGVPLWRAFLAARHRLADDAARITEEGNPHRYDPKPTPHGAEHDYRRRTR